jgi:DNA-binding response OmpR family regulator
MCMLVTTRSCSFVYPRSTFRVLYVGSDSRLVERLGEVLSGPEYRVISCSDHGGAILFLKSEIPYQLLLIDLEWRSKEGLKLARLAHTLKHRDDLTTMLVAATKLTRHMKAVARKAGIHECIIKTEDMAEVIAEVRTAISEQRRLQP